MQKTFLVFLFLSYFGAYSQVVTYYRDADLDLYGNPAISQTSSTGAPSGYVLDNTDCNDSDPNLNPGEIDICNNLDDNCNGWIDEGGIIIYYRDFDNDGFGAASSGTVTACSAPPGYVSNNTDCDDADPNINPNVLEINNGIDDNCDGNIDELVTSIIELNAKDKIYFYPNPASDNITVIGITFKIKYQLINYIGVVVQEDYIDEKNSSISIKYLSTGLYQLKLFKDKVNALKLIKE